LHLPRVHLLLVLAATALLAVGTAAAAWSITGKGSGTAKASGVTSLVLADTSGFTTAGLVPGSTADLKLRISNPNGFPVRITAVSGNGAITSDKGAACDVAAGVTVAAETGLALDLGAGATSTLTVPNAMSMSNSSANACQGAVFAVPVSLAAVSNA
jgi:hypothetical protein